MTRRELSRSQSGFTFIELVITVAISSVVLIPLFVWVNLAMVQQSSTRRDLIETNAVGLLRTYFARDVAGAGQADALAVAVVADDNDPWTLWNRDDCVGGAGAGGSVKLVLIQGGAAASKVVYSEAPSSAYEADEAGTTGESDSGPVSLWRRECSSSTGTDTQAVEVVANVVAGSSTATCAPRASGLPCRRIGFEITAGVSGRTLELRASRRVDAIADEADASGNHRPVARIDVLDRVGTHPMTVTLSGGPSFDSDGDPLTYEWTFEPDVQVVDGSATSESVTVVLSEFHDYSAILTVTDSSGAFNTTYRLLRPSNAPPVAVLGVTADADSGGAVSYNLSSTGSTDPEGAPLTFRWLIVVVQVDATVGTQVVSSEPNYRYTPPAGTTGVINITLTVTDDNGATSSESKVVELPDSTTTTVPDGAPVAAFTSVSGADPLDQTFDATTSTDDGAVVGYDWTFGLLEGSGDGALVTHRFGGPGTYSVTLTVTDDAGHINTVSRTVTIAGVPAEPAGLELVGSDLRWDPVHGTTGYLVEFRFFAEVGCDTAISPIAVGPSSRPVRVVPANPCSVAAEVSARVANKGPGAPVWSPWASLATVEPGTTP